MKQPIRALVRRTPLYHPLREWLIGRSVEQWEKRGRPVPPPHRIKANILVAYAHRYGLRTLVETGTYRGDMIAALKDRFERIYSIELSSELAAQAQRRFHDQRHIHLLHGDSGAVIGQIMPLLKAPALFWLDGHYSGGDTAQGAKDTPILQELDHIFQAPDIGHVLIIDDARDFGGSPSYPSLETLADVVHAAWPRAHFSVEDDSIRVVSARWL